MRFAKHLLYSAVLFGCFLVSGCSSHDASLEQSIRQMLDFNTFDVNKLDTEASVLVAHMDSHQKRFYTREEIADVVEVAKKTHTKYAISDFKILHEQIDGGFASVIYQVRWKASVDGKDVNTRMVSHEIWENKNGEWLRVFAAMDAQ
jgi:hypothetical protein